MIYCLNVDTNEGDIFLFYKTKKEAIEKILNKYKSYFAFIHQLKNKDDPLLDENLVAVFKDGQSIKVEKKEIEGTIYAFFDGMNDYKQLTLFDNYD